MRRVAVAIMALLGSLANQASAEPIKIALPVLSLEPMPIFIAQDKGFSKKHSVDVDVIAHRGGEAIGSRRATSSARRRFPKN